MIITIDGPAGAGKTTTARQLAEQLGVPYLDTGAMYRVVTLAALEDGVELGDEAALRALAQGADFDLELAPGGIRVLLRGRDVTDAIRTMRVNDNTPFIASSPGVRAALIAKQREIAGRVGSLVTEGRDQGTAAFPEADCKFFLIADLDTRARRRLSELADSEQVSLAAVRGNLAQRDESDARRPIAPLIRPSDAVDVDTTDRSIDEVVAAMTAALRERGLLPARRDA